MALAGVHQRGEWNGMYRHGEYTAEAIAERKALADLLRLANQTLNEL
jgi:hypothetical protein